jgi:hypothetical protein
MLWRPVSIASLILLASCTSDGNAPIATDSFCATQRPILVSKRDVLTEITARDILVHNDYGAAKCGWKPGR